MKVALVTPISLCSFGGAERKLIEASEILVKKGNEVSIHALPYTHPKHKVKIDESIHSLKHSGVEYHESRRHIIDADVAYVVYSPLVWRQFKFKCPIIAGLHSPLLFPSIHSVSTFVNPISTIKRYSSLKYLGAFWSSIILRTLDLAQFSAVRILNRVVKVAHKNLYHIPEWVNCKNFRPKSSEKYDEFTVFFSGRHHWEKGYYTFLKIARMLTKKHSRIRFLCTGKGHKEVEGMGFLDDAKLAEVYSRSHLVLYPSKMDVFSGVITEAAACSTPVITSPIPAHTSMNLHLIYASKESDFVKSTIRIYNMWKQNTEEYEKLARVQREQALKYDIDKVFPKFELMLKQVAEN